MRCLLVRDQAGASLFSSLVIEVCRRGMKYLEPPRVVLTKLKQASMNNCSGSCVACWSETRQGQHYFIR
jgi:hypothetical protein